VTPEPTVSGEEVLSYCRICVAACGIKVTVDGERVVRVRGDKDHPVSRGYTCSKGRGLADWHHSTHRLDRPRLRGVDVSWDELLTDLAGALGAIRSEGGPDAVGAYLATGVGYDAGGQMAAGSFLRAIGSSSAYSATTVDNAPVLVGASMVAGNAALRPIWDPSRPGLLILIGTNPVVSHGYGTALPDPVTQLRGFRSRSGRVWVLDPRRSESAALADEHLAVRPGSDIAVLASLVSALLEEGTDPAELAEYCRDDELAELATILAPFTLARAAAAADVSEDSLRQLLADVRSHTRRVSMLVGTGGTMSTDGLVLEWLRWLVLILTGSLDRPEGMPFHHSPAGRTRPRRPKDPSAPPRARPAGPASRPELPRVGGELPSVALVDEIEAGNLEALVVIGGNPIAALPDPDRTRAALSSLPVLAVVDVVDREMAQMATHVLPAVGQLERSDVTLFPVSVPSRAQTTDAVVPPVADRRPMWWSLGSLCRRMDLDLLRGIDPDDLTDDAYLRGALSRSDTVDVDELFAAGPHGVDIAVEHGWVHDLLPDGHWRLVPDGIVERLATYAPPGDGLVLTPRREMGWNNSAHYGGPEDAPMVRLHPRDADAHGLVSGATVVVRSEHGSLTAAVTIDPAVRPGVVSVTHGRPAQSPGTLTSATADVDTLTGMPKASGVQVTLELG
jgi:anaerobic selenocysteine-containing dehydrogenase